jgi:hypothetical protein
VLARSIIVIVLAAGCASSTKRGLRQFTQPDALAFVWGSGAVAATAYVAADPSTSPHVFSDGEGGKVAHGNTISNWEVAAGVAMAPVLIASSSSDASWYHSKGVVQSVLTTAALTEVAKNAFSRHRPKWLPTSTNEDDRKSFFSGHSSLTLATTTYVGLYLHRHVFSQWRGDARVAWWEIPPYLALAAASVWIPYTRIEDNMHHPSDVFVGGVVGATLSTAFFMWQEARYRNDQRMPDEVIVVPLVDTPGAAVVMAFD